MIPLRDSSAPRRFTPINSLLIAINLVVFGYQWSLGPRADEFVIRYAMVPDRIVTALRSFGTLQAMGEIGASLLTILTSMFLHGGILHIAGNLLYLFIFGAAVEWRLGSRRYVLFYLVSGIAAAVATILISPESDVPVIGASGSIAGVLGAYFVFYPRGRITTVLPLLIFIEVIEVPAVIYLLLWFGLQLRRSHRRITGCSGWGVAWWAHIGGFCLGLRWDHCWRRRNGVTGASEGCGYPLQKAGIDVNCRHSCTRVFTDNPALPNIAWVRKVVVRWRLLRTIF